MVRAGSRTCAGRKSTLSSVLSPLVSPVDDGVSRGMRDDTPIRVHELIIRRTEEDLCPPRQCVCVCLCVCARVEREVFAGEKKRKEIAVNRSDPVTVVLGE